MRSASGSRPGSRAGRSRPRQRRSGARRVARDDRAGSADVALPVLLTPLTEFGVGAAAEAIRRGETTSSALVEACLGRIAATDASMQAWVTVDGSGASAAALARDGDLLAGRPIGPLHGVPLGIKDIIDGAGMTTTARAAAFAHTRPYRDDTPVARLAASVHVICGN